MCACLLDDGQYSSSVHMDVQPYPSLSFVSTIITPQLSHSQVSSENKKALRSQKIKLWQPMLYECKWQEIAVNCH